jgi:hypothetical protein
VAHNLHAPRHRLCGGMLGRFTVQILKAAHGSAWSAAVRLQHSEYGDPVRRHDASARAQMVCAGTTGAAMLTLQETACTRSQQRASFSC